MIFRIICYCLAVNTLLVGPKALLDPKDQPLRPIFLNRLVPQFAKGLPHPPQDAPYPQQLRKFISLLILADRLDKILHRDYSSVFEFAPLEHLFKLCFSAEIIDFFSLFSCLYLIILLFSGQVCHSLPLTAIPHINFLNINFNDLRP